MFHETIFIDPQPTSCESVDQIKLKHPLFIGNPHSLQIFGFEYTLMIYLLKRKLLKKNFYIRHHPQVPLWKIKLTELVFGQRVIRHTEPIEHYKIPFLVQTYDSTLARSNNVSRVRRV